MTKKFIGIGVCLFCAGFLFAQNVNVVEQVSSEMVTLPGGTFIMGSEGFENNETPLHEVEVKEFMISCYEIKQNEYRGIVGINYSNNKGDELPVEEVSFYDALVFCNMLSLAQGFEPCYSLKGETDPEKWGEVPRITDENLEDEKKLWDLIECNFDADGYRLPTEAEWEYAAFGGGEKEYSYSGSDSASDAGWVKNNSNDTTQTVGTKAANAYGLYDMTGNVWEWCWDWYTGKYDASYDEGTDLASVTGRRIRRGGSVKSSDEFARIRNRATSVPELRGVDLGFRVVRTVKSTVGKAVATAVVESGVEEALPVLEEFEEK